MYRWKYNIPFFNNWNWWLKVTISVLTKVFYCFYLRGFFACKNPFIIMLTVNCDADGLSLFVILFVKQYFSMRNILNQIRDKLHNMAVRALIDGGTCWWFIILLYGRYLRFYHVIHKARCSLLPISCL